MTQENTTERCDGCGKTTDLTETHGNEFCKDCLGLVTALQKKPETIKRICNLIKSDLSHNGDNDSECHISELKELPEVLDAVRFRTRDRELNTWYVSVSELKGDPVEIFASTAFDRDDHLQSRISNLTTITRLVSLILRNVFLDEVLTLEKQLNSCEEVRDRKMTFPTC